MLFLLLFITFSIPSIQTYFGEYATNRINNKFNTNINIERASIKYNGDIELKNILIIDHQNDSLISIEKFNSSILSFLNINNNKLVFGGIDIYGLYFNIKTYKGENDSNLEIFSEKFRKIAEIAIFEFFRHFEQKIR